MNLKRMLILLEKLGTPDNADVILVIERIREKIREQIAINDFKSLAKDYFTESEIKELIYGYYTGKSVIH